MFGGKYSPWNHLDIYVQPWYPQETFELIIEINPNCW